MPSLCERCKTTVGFVSPAHASCPDDLSRSVNFLYQLHTAQISSKVVCSKCKRRMADAQRRVYERAASFCLDTPLQTGVLTCSSRVFEMWSQESLVMIVKTVLTATSSLLNNTSDKPAGGEMRM